MASVRRTTKKGGSERFTFQTLEDAMEQWRALVREARAGDTIQVFRDDGTPYATHHEGMVRRT